MKLTADIKLTKEEAKLLLQILQGAMIYPTNRPRRASSDDVHRIYNKVMAEQVVLSDMEKQ